MDLVTYTYLSFFLFLLGFFTLLYFKGLVRIAIGMQLIIFSGVFNFLGFSYYLYQGSLWDKTFSILSLAVIYLLLFCIFFYAHSMIDGETLTPFNRLGVLEWGKCIWWGEDKS